MFDAECDQETKSAMYTSFSACTPATHLAHVPTLGLDDGRLVSTPVEVSLLSTPLIPPIQQLHTLNVTCNAVMIIGVVIKNHMPQRTTIRIPSHPN